MKIAGFEGGWHSAKSARPPPVWYSGQTMAVSYVSQPSSRSTRRTIPYEIACSFGNPFSRRRAAMSASVVSNDMEPRSMIYARRRRCQVLVWAVFSRRSRWVDSWHRSSWEPAGVATGWNRIPQDHAISVSRRQASRLQPLAADRQRGRQSGCRRQAGHGAADLDRRRGRPAAVRNGSQAKLRAVACVVRAAGARVNGRRCLFAVS